AEPAAGEYKRRGEDIARTRGVDGIRGAGRDLDACLASIHRGTGAAARDDQPLHLRHHRLEAARWPYRDFVTGQKQRGINRNGANERSGWRLLLIDGSIRVETPLHALSEYGSTPAYLDEGAKIDVVRQQRREDDVAGA